MKKRIFFFVLTVIITNCISAYISIAQTKNFELSGLEKYDKENYNGALADFDKHIEQNPNDTTAYFNRARAKAMLGDLQGSLQDNTKTLELDPKFQKALFNRALDKMDLGNPQGAIEDYTQLIKLNPENVSEIYKKRGSIKHQLNDNIGANIDMNKAIEIDPTYVDAYVGRALINMDGKPDIALIDLNIALDLDKQNASAYFVKGIIQLKHSNNPEACNNIEKAVLLNYEPAKAYFENYCSISSQTEFVNQKINFYKTNYLNAPNSATKSLFLDQSKHLTNRFLDSLNYLILNWDGEVDRVWLGNKASDIQLLKQGLTPNQVIEKDPNDRPLAIAISFRKKIGNSSYAILLIQEQDKTYNGGIRSTNPLYNKVINLQKGQKINFSAKVNNVIEYVTNQEHATIFTIELTHLK